ncbi:MAG: hypothetical protein RLZZ84_2019 [Pseudomonadota bacterium]|jgi:outer membrane receptor protein involved in Fe transport
MTRTPFLLTAAALFLPAVANAAEAAPEGAIVVTGRGLQETPAAPAYDVQRIDSDQLRSAASGRIEDALSAVAGFQQFRRSDSRSSNPTAQGVTLRALGGNASSRSLVLLDGVPMADPFFGHIPLSAIAPERLAAARVTRGGGAGAFGSGAVAGTIELDSAGPDQLGLVSGTLLGSDRGDSELSGSLSPRLGSGFAVLSGRWDRGDGFWTTPVAQRVPASARARYDSWSAGVRAVAPLTPDVELQARGLAFGDHRTLRFKGAETSTEGQDASLRLVGKGAWQFDLLGYVQARNFTNIVVSSTSFKKTLDQRNTPATGWGGKAELRPPVGDAHVLRIGSDWRVASGTMFEDAYSAATGLVTARRSAGGRGSDVGFYVEDDWTLGALTLTGGGRADRWTIASGFFREANAAGLVTTDTQFASRAGWDGSLRGGAVLQVGGGLDLRGSAYSGLRQPTLNELYRPFTVFPVTTRANAALANERLVGFEGGLDYAPLPGLRLTLTGFDNRVAHAIANVTIAANVRERRNVDAVHARGVEAGLEARLGQFTLDGSLAWTHARVEASGTSIGLNGKRPAQTPRLAASAGLGWKPAAGWNLALRIKHVGAQFEDDLETDVLPAATTLDGFAELPVGKGFSVVLRAENLTDAAVMTRNQAGSIDLGPPRTLWAGLRISIGQ